MTVPTAKSVAQELERRRTRRRLAFLALVVAAIALAITYLTCGQGFGLGGKGKGKGEGSGSAVVPADSGPRRCVIRVAASGLTVDGAPAARDAVVAACKATEGAEVTITGDARQGDWDDLRGALEAAGVTIYTKQNR